MTAAQEFLQNKLTTLLEPGEKVVTQGVGMDATRWLLAMLWPFSIRFYYIVLTDRRLISIKMKSRFVCRLGFPVFALQVGVTEEKLIDIKSFPFTDLAKIYASRETPITMLWGRRGIAFEGKDGKKLRLVLKRRDGAMPDQRKFYNEILAESARLTEIKPELPPRR